MHWQDIPTKKFDSINNSIQLQNSNSTRYNKFVDQKSSQNNNHHHLTRLKDKNITSQIIIQSVVSRSKYNKNQSDKKHKEYLKNRIKEISLGQRTPLEKDNNYNDQQSRIRKDKKDNVPTSVYKVIRDMKNLLSNLKGTLQLISKMFQISLVVWRKGMDQFSKKNANLIENNLDRATSVLSQYAEKILAQSAPQKDFVNSNNRYKRLIKKYTLTSIPNARQDDLEKKFNFELKQETVIDLKLPDLSNKDIQIQKKKTQQQVSDFGQSFKNNKIGMSSNLEILNNEKKQNYLKNFDGSFALTPKSKQNQKADFDSDKPSQILIESNKLSNKQNRKGDKRHKLSQCSKKSKKSQKYIKDNTLKKSNSKKKDIEEDFDDINNYLLKLKKIVQ